MKNETNMASLTEVSTIKTKDGRSVRLIAIAKKDLPEYLNVIAGFRIKYFREYPYLYVGNVDYERHYIQGFADDDRSLLILAIHDDELVAISTAIPMNSGSDILTDAVTKFVQSGLDPSDFYYYGEIIIKPEYRGLGLARSIYDYQERFAKSLGYNKIAIATVVRAENDRRRPTGYISSDLTWSALGFKKAGIFIDYEWPTIVSEGRVLDVLNPMEFWIKDIRR